MPDTDTQTTQPQPGQNNPYRTLQDMETRLRSIQAELRRIDQMDAPSEEDANFQGTLIQEYDQLDEKATPLRKRMADIRRITQDAANPDNREDGAPRTRQAPEMFVRNHQDPLENLDAVRAKLVASGELRTRAETLIERDHKRYELTHDYAETATRRAISNPRVAAHILLTGSQEYRDAFRSYLEDPDVGVQRLRALTLGTASAGFMLPYVLDPTIVLTNAGSANPFRRVCRMETTTSNAWQGVNSAGVNAAWVLEGATAADATPTVGQIQITPVKGAAWVFGSYESLDDTNFGEQLPGLLADGRDRLESAAFCTGTGGTGSPLGFISGAYGTANATFGTATTGAAGAQLVYSTQASLPPRFRNSPQAAWMASLPWINTYRALDQTGGSSFWANLGAGTPEQLLGQNIYEASDMRNTTTAITGSGGVALAYADWKQMIIVDRVGVSMLYEPMLKASGNASLPTGNAGWYMFWRTGSGIAATGAFKFLVSGSAA